MESNTYRTNFSCFVRMALKNDMAWKTLAIILKDLTPTLIETREVISILLNELEALQSRLQMKEKELEKYQDSSSTTAEIQKIHMKHQKNALETEFTTGEIQENEQQSSVPEDETIEDEIEVLEVIKESMNEEMYLDMNKGTKSSDELVNEENDSYDAFESMGLGEIDSEWYTFVTDAKTFIPEIDAPVQEKEFCTENEPTSSNGSEDGKHMTFQKEHATDKPVKQVDNEWYTLVANDKKSDSETKKTVESDETVTEKAKKRPYQCTFCQKAFQNSSNLKNHVRIHTGEVPFECKTCKKRFNKASNLKKHEMIHTGEKPFECKTCKKRFTQKCVLKAHERIHTGEVPYECKTCKKRFKQSIHVKRHERIHTGEEPYECKSFSKRFNQQSALKIHERIHTGEEPYECKRCGKGFKQSPALRFHEKHHK